MQAHNISHKNLSVVAQLLKDADIKNKRNVLPKYFLWILWIKIKHRLHKFPLYL